MIMIVMMDHDVAGMGESGMYHCVFPVARLRGRDKAMPCLYITAY
jgi:hypothetical protein